MLELKAVDPAILKRRSEEYNEHLNLVSQPDRYRAFLAKLLQERGYEVRPEYFRGAELATGKGTEFNKTHLMHLFGIDGVFEIYPSTISVQRWDEYSTGIGPFQKMNGGLREGLGKGEHIGGMTTDVYYPPESEMLIKLITVKTPQEDIHHARRLIKGVSRGSDETILDELHAMQTDVYYGIRNWGDAKGSILAYHKSCGREITETVEKTIDDTINALKSMRKYLSLKEIGFLLTASTSIVDFISIKGPTDELRKLNEELNVMSKHLFV